MLSHWLVTLVSLAYIILLFAIAYWGDLRVRKGRRSVSKPVIYSLTLSVFCTAWGFYGTVGQAAVTGWLIVPTYIGPFLIFALGWRFIDKLVRAGRDQHISSIADFISARYGKSQSLAALVAVIAVIGVVPYIALQLKAVSVSYNTLTGTGGEIVAAAASNMPFWQDTALYVALVMGLFSILFGTRHLDATEHHEGMMLAIAFESVVKLVAFLVVGGFITYGLFDGFSDLTARANADPQVQSFLASGAGPYTFITQAALSLTVMFCLPRQFHVAVVENTNPRDIRTARWMFPLYLIAINSFVLPVALAGLLYFPLGSVDTDTFMLTLPMAAAQPDLALLSFIGGLSAGTGMVIVATLALSIMTCNDVVMPALLHWRRLGLERRRDLSGLLLAIRRMAILAILLLAWLYYRLIAEYAALASFGVLSFAAVAQFAPAIVGGVYWRGGSRNGAIAGLLVGFGVWLYTLLIPTFVHAGWISQGLLDAGPFGLSWLRPQGLFGLDGLGGPTHGVLWSLSLNIGTFVVVSLFSHRGLNERVQAAAFVDIPSRPGPFGVANRANATVEDLRTVAERFTGVERASAAFAGYGDLRGSPLSPSERAEDGLIQLTEQMLASVLGASSAHVVLNSVLRGRDMQFEQVADILGTASQTAQFNRELLQAAIESVTQGLAVVDRNLRLVAWNSRFLELFHLPSKLVQIGSPLESVLRHKAARDAYGPVDDKELTRLIDQRLEAIRQGQPYSFEWTRADGSVLEVRGNPMPGFGFVITYSDITEHKHIQTALRESEQNIRVYTDNVPTLIAYIDRDRRFRFTNRAYEAAWGLRRDQLYGRRIEDVFPRSFFDRRLPYLEGVLAGRAQSFETELPTPEGGLRHALGTYIPDVGSDGDILGFYALFQDITERIDAERALKEINETLEQRVRQRTEALTELNTALSAAKAEAERANLSKTRFLAAASHDLLQPLNAAALFTSALEQRMDEKPERELVDNIQGSLKAADGLLSELLDISRLEAGVVQPHYSEFPIDELLARLGVEFQALAEQRGLVLHRVASRAWVRSDRRLLRRVLQNFLSNALRYTRQGKVLLGCRRRGGRLRIEVWDTGPGIPDDQLEHIFQEFHRLDQQDQHGEKCLGLGLAIAERIAQTLGYRIDVRSRPGSGTVFAVEVPLAASRTRPATPQNSAPPSPLDEARVLCVDNEPAVLEGMLALLEGWSCTVMTATSLEETRLLLATAPPPTLILADYHLDNGNNGLAVIDTVRVHCQTQVPAIVITADHTDAVRLRAERRHCTVLKKPVKPAALRALMSQLLGKR